MFRWLHKTPELAHAETETSAYIRRELKAMRIRFRGDIAGNSIVATVGSGSPRVALRAAMDSLPIKVGYHSFRRERLQCLLPAEGRAGVCSPHQFCQVFG